MSTAHEFDIAIIGGGAAGIGAALALQDRPCSVVLLEASQRLGGRAWTHHVGGNAIDMGCNWLHSADRNAWTRRAFAEGVEVDQRPAAWDAEQPYPGFSAEQHRAASTAFDQWHDRLANDPPASDRAADALPPGGEWNAYIQAMSGYISGARLESISAVDYNLYEGEATSLNWRLPMGYGAFIVRSMPWRVPVRLSTPVRTLRLAAQGGVEMTTDQGLIRARAVIVTVSSHVIASGQLGLPPGMDAWREAAAKVPLGCDEKLYFSIDPEWSLPEETLVLGNPHRADTGAYYLRPLGHPLVECFLGGPSAQRVTEEGLPATFAWALDELAGVLGPRARTHLTPLVGSQWGRTDFIGGSYSHALPHCAPARQTLAASFEGRIFMAGEATHARAFSTAHGAYETGVRAAMEASEALGVA
jgi:monoamine oxidase